MEMITPCIDLAFRKIFGVAESEDLLISFINFSVRPEDQLSEVTLLNSYDIQSFWQDKLSILDIKAKSQDGKRFNIESQISDETDYDKRDLYYWGPEMFSKIQTSLDLWMAFLTRHDLLQKDHLPPFSEEAAFQKALDVLETMNLKLDERET